MNKNNQKHQNGHSSSWRETEITMEGLSPAASTSHKFVVYSAAQTIVSDTLAKEIQPKCTSTVKLNKSRLSEKSGYEYITWGTHPAYIRQTCIHMNKEYKTKRKHGHKRHHNLQP